MCKIAGEPKQRLNPEAAGQNMLQKAVRIMKLTAVILLISCLQVNAEGYGQRISLSEKEVPVEKVFNEIKRQTGYKFLYNSSILDGTKSVTIQVKDATVAEVLDLCLNGQSLEYKIRAEDNLIIILKQKSITNELQGLNNSPVDPIEIRGVITDENGVPALGVNVMVKGTNKGTTTNLKGEFILRDVNEKALLVITSVGYDKQEIPVRNKEFISLKLKVAVGNLDEMQVIAYGTTSKRFNTGNVTTIKASEIEKQPVNNPLLALQGRVPGLVITQNTGVPGGGITVRIQGQNSMTKGNDPLYVIDGVPYMQQVPSVGLGNVLGNSGSYNAGTFNVTGVGNPLAFINTRDIESIEILRDADATAIYGSRAANGAILITTKKGKAGGTKVNVNFQNGWGKVTRKLKMMNSRDYLDMRYKALENDGIDINAVSTSSSYYDLKAWDTTRYTDWQKVLIGGTAQYINVNGTVSGGTENMQYLVSGTYQKETTVFPGDFSDEKGNMHFSINSTSSARKFYFQISGSYMMDKNELPNVDLTNNAVLFEPVAPDLYNSDGSINWQRLPSGTSTFNFNPMASLTKIYRNKTNNLVGNTVIGYRLNHKLSIQTHLGYTKMQSKEYAAFPLISIRPEARPNSERIAHYGFKEAYTWIAEPQVLYGTKIVGGKLDVLIGSSIQQYGDAGFFVEGRGYGNDNILENMNAAISLTSRDQLFSEYKYNAFFGRINYNLKDKYIFNFNGRRDGSSRFGENNRFHNFGSIGLAWIFSEEKALPRIMPFLSFGKIRASYGTTGNDLIGDYAFMNLYGNTSADVAYQGTAGLEPNGLTNPYYQWEQTTKFSLGTDLGFFTDRLLFNFTYARNRSSNQLLSYILPQFTGGSTVVRNFPATVQNTSLEFSVNSVNFKGKSFTWTSNLNLTIPRNKLVSFPDLASSPYSTTFVVGQPLAIQRVWRFLGVDPVTGLYLAADNDGNPTSKPVFNRDRNVLVSMQPNFYGGLLNSITYKGFQLDFLFQFVRQKGKNYKYYNGDMYPGQFSRGRSNQPVTAINAWQKSDDVAEIQKYSTSLFGSVATLSDAAFSDASYIRLKNLSFSYSLPKKLLQQVHMRDLRIYMQGQNLLTITDYIGLDPENQSISSLPPLSILTIGVQLEL